MTSLQTVYMDAQDEAYQVQKQQGCGNYITMSDPDLV